MEPAAAVAKAAANADEITSVRYRMSGRTPEEGRIRGEAMIGTKPQVMSLKSTVLSGPDKGTGEFRFVGGVLYVNRSGPKVVPAGGPLWALDVRASS